MEDKEDPKSDADCSAATKTSHSISEINDDEISELNTTDKLVFSDSDSDELSKQIISKPKRSKQIIDSDSDNDTTEAKETAPKTNDLVNNKENEINNEDEDMIKCVNNSPSKNVDKILTETTDDDEQINMKNRKKLQKSKLIDSDSESEKESSMMNGTKVNHSNNIDKIVSDASDSSIGHDKETHKKKLVKKSTLIDSDSESENESTKNHSTNQKTINKMQFTDESTDKDSNDDEIEKSLTKSRTKKKTKKKVNQKVNSENDSSDSDEEINASNNKKRISSLCDSDSSSSNDNVDFAGGSYLTDANTKSVKPTKKKERPPQRMSAKEADEQMKIIQSESQRMAREAQISVPYHRPKQRTLHEFLNRKTIQKPIPFLNQKKAAAAIKMSHDELETYAKLLEEREKESLNFFKSDSDNDDDEPTEIKSNTEINSQPSVLTTNNDNPIETTTTSNCNNVEAQTTEDILTVENQPITLITEVETETIGITVTDNVLPSIGEKIDDLTPEIDTQLRIESTEEIFKDATPTIEQNCTTKSLLLHNGKNIEIDYDFGNEKKKFGSLTTAIMSHVNNNTVPSIRGGENTVIDLETGNIMINETSGADELFQRFLKHSNKIQMKEFTNFDIIRTTNDRIDFEKMPLALDEDAPVIQNCKPRSLYAKLKETLGKEIARKKREEMAKKTLEALDNDNEDEINSINESDSENESICKVSDEENKDDTNKIEKQPENKDSDKDNDENLDESVQLFSDAEDEKGDDDDDDEDDDDDDEDRISDEQDTILNANGPKILKRIHLMDDSDNEEKDSEEAINNKSSKIITETQSQLLHTTSDFETNNQSINNLSSSDHLETSTDNLTAFNRESNTLYTQDDAEVSDSQLLNLCSGVFVTQKPDVIQGDDDDEDEEKNEHPTRLAFESSDEDESGENTKKECKANKKSTNKVKKLNFSDDENENDSTTDNKTPNLDINDDDSLQNSEIEDEEEEENVERVVEYDSEENEVEVIEKVIKKPKMSAFLENEAELSESDWGSADEDEKDLDKLDIELGDEDHFDQEELQSELGKIHLRRVLDQDIREVKIIEDMLFEDEEFNGLGRERQFKWKNVDNNINLDEFRSINNDDNVELRESDEENEEQWRKMRHERNILLSENQNNDTTTAIGSESILKKKIKIIKSANTTPQYSAKNSPFLINNTVDSGGIKNVTRSSFLTRDDKTLQKLATFTKSSNDGSDGNDVVIASAIGKAKNFVFSTRSPVPVERQNNKRKSEDYTIEGETIQKKLKHFNIENENQKSKKRLLDFLA